jgi:hypothetical protein
VDPSDDGVLRDIRIVEIFDPVAQVRYVLDPRNHAAHRSAPPPPSEDAPELPATRSRLSPAQALQSVDPAIAMVDGKPSHGAVSGAGFRHVSDGGEVTTEQLGQRTIEGFVADGTRKRMILRPWFRVTGSEGHVYTSETWRSRQLGVTLYRKQVNPNGGEDVTRLTRISATEPDPALFQPPWDYTIVEETGHFQITVPRE